MTRCALHGRSDNTRRGLVAAILVCAAVASAAVMAQDCLVSPTTKEVVSGRFGKFRAGGAANFGSGNSAVHMHDGIDFSTDNSAEPLYSVTNGSVLFVGPRGSAGNAVLIKRSDGDIVAYYHLSGFAKEIVKGATVTPGQLIGLSGNTNQGSSTNGEMARHLHFVYGVAQEDQARAKAFPSNAAQGPFNPAQLPTSFNEQSGIGWKTDPAPYFCKTYPIRDGHPEDYTLLGADTKAQYQKLFGSVPPAGGIPASSAQFDVGEVEAANQDAALASAAKQAGASAVVSNLLSDSNGYGSLPQPAIGDYDTMSRREMLLTEANRRFSSADWNTNVTSVDSRALWVDFLRARGVGIYLDKAIADKRARVEALLAVYESLKMARLRQQVQTVRDNATRQNISQSIQ